MARIAGVDLLLYANKKVRTYAFLFVSHFCLAPYENDTGYYKQYINVKMFLTLYFNSLYTHPSVSGLQPPK